jgi:phage gp45-like
LKKVGAGEQNAADNLVDAYVGTHLDQKIADAAAQINNPAQRSNVSNDAPLAVDDLVTAQGPITIDVLANDSDPNGDRLQVTLLTAPNGISGSVLLNPDGKTILYTPKSGFLGKESFNYIVGDGKGGLKNANVQVTVTTTRNDFSGDGKSDILWRNDYGSVALWQMDGATVTTAGLTSISDVDASWTTAGTGDFNGDGKSDVLWRNPNGAVAVWTMNGAIVTSSSSTSIPALDNSWTVAGLGDYNGDSKSDILWRNTNGAVAIWAMNGPTVSSSSLTSTPTVDSSWQVAGNGDFNGDGQSDILWRNDDGTVALWQMNGSAVTAATAVFKVAADWKITGNGDFNGDGKSDILWRNDDGSVALWQMNGANITSSKLTSTPVLDQSWSLAEIGD